MGLTLEQRKKVECLSSEKEGALFSKPAAAASTAAVVIGLGGLGGTTVNELKRKVLKDIINPELIRFLVVDSDETALKELRESSGRNGYLKDEETVNIYSQSLLAELRRKNAGNLLNDAWTPETALLMGPPATGAGAMRQTGHQMITRFDTYSQLACRLQGLLMEVYRDIYAAGIKKMEIILISGIAGGTGGGIICDTAYLIRNIMRGADIREYRLSAYLYMPGVQLAEPGRYVEPQFMNVMKRNGYETLKEIVSYMNLVSNHGRYCLEIGRERYESHENIFDRVMVIDGCDSMGHRRREYETIQLLTENLMDILVDTKAAIGIPYFELISENVGYQIQGYTAMVVPVQQVLTYGVAQAYRKMHDRLTDHKKADEKVVHEVLSAAGLADRRNLLEMIMSVQNIQFQNPLTDDELPSREEIRHGRGEAMYGMLMQMAHQQLGSLHSCNFGSRLKGVIYDSLEKALDNVMMREGPYYVSALIDGSTGSGNGDSGFYFPGIITYIEYLKERLFKKENESRMKGQCLTNGMKECEQRASAFLAGRNERRIYVDCIYDAVEQSVYLPGVLQILRGILDAVGQELRERYESYWKSCTETLDLIDRILREDTDRILHLRDMTSSYRYLIDLDETKREGSQLKNYLDSLSDKTAVSDLTAGFLRSMLTDRPMWTGGVQGGRFDPVGEIREIFERFVNQQMEENPVEKLIAAAYYPEQLTGFQLNRLWVDRTKNGIDLILQDIASRIRSFLEEQDGMMAGLPPHVNYNEFPVRTVVGAPAEARLMLMELFAWNPGGTAVHVWNSGRVRFICSRIVSSLPLDLLEAINGNPN